MADYAFGSNSPYEETSALRRDIRLTALRSDYAATSALPEHILQHAVADHGLAVELDRGAHHRQIEMP